jgi:hypothetical protein
MIGRPNEVPVRSKVSLKNYLEKGIDETVSGGKMANENDTVQSHVPVVNRPV